MLNIRRVVSSDFCATLYQCFADQDNVVCWELFAITSGL